MNACLVRNVAHLAFVALLLLSCSACKPKDEITSYTVERTSPPREPFEAAKIAAELDRIVAAMLPVDDKAYFFKLSGKTPAIDRQRDDFNRFLVAVDKGNSVDKPLTWELPEDWREKGASEMRLNTIVIPDEGGELEIAVSSLPISGTWVEFVDVNVNRWLGQLGQGELARQKVLNLTEKVETRAGSATVIELAGVLKETMPMNPHGSVAQNITADKPPEDIAPPTRSGASEISYDAPEGWQEGPPMPTREATYLVADGNQKAEFTVSAWQAPAGSQMADVTANVQRWAAQVGLPVDDKLSEIVEEIDIDGTKGSSVRLVGPEGSAGKAMLAAMAVRGEKVWFFKLFGNATLVEHEGENFREFLDSVRFK